MIKKRDKIVNIPKISKDVTLSAVKQLLTLLQLAEKDYPIYQGVLEEKTKVISSIHKRRDRGIEDRSVIYTYNEEANIDRAYTSQMSSKGSTSLISDKPFLDIYVTPVNVTTQISLRIESKDISDLELIKSRLKEMLRTNRDDSLIRGLVNYSFTENIERLIKNVYDNKVRNCPDSKDLTLAEYIAYHGSDFLTYTSDVAAVNIGLGIKGVISNIYLRLDKGLYSIELTKDVTNYLTFDFTIQYDRPTYFDVLYESMAYNQPLDPGFLQIKTWDRPEYDNNQFQQLEQWFKYTFNRNILNEYKHGEYIHIPATDIYKEYVGLDNSIVGIPLLSVLLEVETQQAQFNISNLGNLNIDPLLVEFMIYDREYINKPYYSVMHMAHISEDGVSVPLSLGEDGSVYADMNPCTINRVLISIIKDPDELLGDAWQRFIDWLKLKYPYLSGNFITDALFASQLGFIFRIFGGSFANFNTCGELRYYLDEKYTCDGVSIPISSCDINMLTNVCDAVYKAITLIDTIEPIRVENLLEIHKCDLYTNMYYKEMFKINTIELEEPLFYGNNSHFTYFTYNEYMYLVLPDNLVYICDSYGHVRVFKNGKLIAECDSLGECRTGLIHLIAGFGFIQHGDAAIAKTVMYSYTQGMLLRLRS